MPTYQYACTACGENLEAVQSFSDPSLTECPACGGQLRKVFSAVGVVFKGSGFYKTDSRSSSTAAEAPKKTETKTESTKDASSAPAKTESSSSTSSSSSSSSSTTTTPAA